jgi:hypothetical protein
VCDVPAAISPASCDRSENLMKGINDMSYEFTRQKLATERKEFIKRFILVMFAGFVGFAIGGLINDIGTFGGILSACMLAAAFGYGVFISIGGVGGRG